MNNIEWLANLFTDRMIGSTDLRADSTVKWFRVQGDTAVYNPREAASADPVDFKLHVLTCILCNRAYNEYRLKSCKNLPKHYQNGRNKHKR